MDPLPRGKRKKRRGRGRERRRERYICIYTKRILPFHYI
jgi:hypothetical protein